MRAAIRGSESEIIDAEIIEPRGWTSPDWCSPAVYRRIRRWVVRLLGWVLVFVLALGFAASLDGHDEPTQVAPARIDVAPCLTACEQLRIDIRSTSVVPHDGTLPSDAPTAGLVKVDDTKVSARCWWDLIDAGFVGRTDNTEHRVYADPDAIAELCTETKADRKFADKSEDDRNGSGTYGPTADVDTPLTR